MASNLDSLDISSLRLQKEYPVAEIQAIHRAEDPENHPEAAAAARARIAAIPEFGPQVDVMSIPSAPTAELITDRTVLAERVAKEPAVTKRGIPSALKPLLTAVGIFGIVLLMFKSPIILSQLNYSLKNNPTAAVATQPAEVIPAENTITIPKINVHAPVVYEPSVAEANVQKALQNGVVHYGNTSAPGDPGNVAIFGHSSNDWWEPGNYKFVFVLLDKLAPGDKITMDYGSKRYTYEVTSSKVVEPTNVGVLAPTAEPTLTLITCTPPGTSLRRLVVSAKQIDPDPKQVKMAASTPAPSTDTSTSLPSSTPGFFTQLAQAWDGVTHGFKSLFGGDSSEPSSAGTTATPGTLPAIK